MSTWDYDTRRPNKAGEAYMKLYNEKWRSKETIQPHQSDYVIFRGFDGTYKIQIMENQNILTELDISLTEPMSVDCVKDIVLQNLDCTIL